MTGTTLDEVDSYNGPYKHPTNPNINRLRSEYWAKRMEQWALEEAAAEVLGDDTVEDGGTDLPDANDITLPPCSRRAIDKNMSRDETNNAAILALIDTIDMIDMRRVDMERVHPSATHTNISNMKRARPFLYNAAPPT